MKAAFFFHNSPLASWSATWGFNDCLKRMGHEVVSVPLPPSLTVGKSEYGRIKQRIPSVNALNSCDLVITMGPEYITPVLEHFYTKTIWRGIKSTKVGLYMESSDRSDTPFDYASLRDWNDEHFYPSYRDIATFGGSKSLSFVDTEMFKPSREPKTLDVGFVGTLYPKRIDFMRQLAPLLSGIEFKCGSIEVRDINGPRCRDWAGLLVENICSMKVFVSLPSNNNMQVAKPFETMACGTCYVGPEIDGDATFVNGEHGLFYRTPNECAAMVRSVLKDSTLRERIAAGGRAHVLKHYSAEKFIDSIFEKVGVAA